MKISEFLPETKRRDKLLYYGGLLNLALLIIFAGIALFDHRVVGGVNTWIKPMKFSLSFIVFLWTFAWMISWIPSERRRRILSIGFTICMVAEITTITAQAARGVRSHFNTSTPLDGINFLIMGIFILLNTLLVLWMLILLARDSGSLRGAARWSVLIGITFFLLGSLSGGMMVSQSAHTVGLPDGGPGLSFLNWSTVGGDLRIPHFFTLHSLQVIPLFGFIIRGRTQHGSTAVIIFAFLYASFCIYLHAHALAGRPIG